MAATKQLEQLVAVGSPMALWHLLSLDAPTVAAVWVWFIARSSHLRLPLADPIATALAVWILYVVDRLLDARKPDAEHAGTADKVEARHRFHYRHRRGFMVGLSVAGVGLVALLPKLDPSAMHLYWIEGSLLLVWLMILHATRSAHRLPKEIALGLFFSPATFIPTVAREPGLRMCLLPVAVLFAALCSINCLFIYAWEHEGLRSTARPARAPTNIALARLPALALAIAFAGNALAIFLSSSAKPVAVACALGAGGLLGLHRNRLRFSRDDLRAAADMALLTPILLFPFLR